MNAAPANLFIFDYSGTLSREAPRFARPESLRRALTESGLAGLGVATPELFWEEIVNPTWSEGSTTRAGYGRVMAKRIAALRLAPGASTGEIDAAAARFVEGYLDHSRIDPRWRPLIARLSGHPEAVTIIATDHYAEATGMIIRNLDAWDIPAEGIDLSFPPRVRAPGVFPENATPAVPLPLHRVIVANSADIGAWKAEMRFWKTVKDRLATGRIARLLVIDDFGFNEEAADSYGGDLVKIAVRQEKTRAGLREVFRVDPEIIPFFREGETRYDDGVFARLITETAHRIDRILE